MNANRNPSSIIFRALRFVALACGLAAALHATAEPRETLGPGDAVRVTVFQNPDFNTETRLSEAGTIVFPLIGEQNFSGLTPAQAGARVADALKRGKFINNPQVTVQLVAVRSRQVSVLGQVAKPGKYPLDDATSKLTDILALAGGITPTGTDEVTVLVTRNGKSETRVVDVPAMMRTGDTKANFDIRGGDTIYVQRAPVFYIYGEVQKAGSYRLENNMSVMQALSVGGGVTPRGTERGMRIHRRNGDGKVFKLEAQPTDIVQADDVIYVRESLF
jgi:polysaccharide export outer membrane protein